MKRIKALITAVILCLAAFVPFTLTAEAEEPVSGFCAVGEVKDSRAAILLADGTVRSVDIEGAAPMRLRSSVSTKTRRNPRPAPLTGQRRSITTPPYS